MRIIFRRYQMLRIGIHPHRAASTRCFSPSWTEVRYTRIMPFQKTMASSKTAQRTPKAAPATAVPAARLFSGVIMEIWHHSHTICTKTVTVAVIKNRRSNSQPLFKYQIRFVGAPLFSMGRRLK